jgi:hypothetical protein
MIVWKLLRVSLALSLLERAIAVKGKGPGSPSHGDDLDLCPGTLMKRHYNIDVDVYDLPETCSPEQLIVVGWLIEDAVQDMEEMAPEYKVSSLHGVICRGARLDAQ